jgi:hypothetical protein
MLMIARLGRAFRAGGPGGIWKVSTVTVPAAVSTDAVLRMQPPGQPDTGPPVGKVNGNPSTSVWDRAGSSAR